MEHLTLAGHSGAFPLTTQAKQLLLDYLQRARQQVRADPDGEESVRDVEASIGDRMRSILNDATTAVDEHTMMRILTGVGPVLTDADPDPTQRAPRLCRIQQGKAVSGLCLGLATRADLRVDWFRTLAFLALLLSGGLLGVIYLVALCFAPRVATARQYQVMLSRDRDMLN